MLMRDGLHCVVAWMCMLLPCALIDAAWYVTFVD
jgi:hypothetical protein